LITGSFPSPGGSFVVVLCPGRGGESSRFMRSGEILWELFELALLRRYDTAA
jgi:hypothetical protein